SRSLNPNGFQIDLRTPSTPSGSQIRGDSIISGLDWELRPSLLMRFRGGWVRSRQEFSVDRPSTSAAQLALPGTASSASQTGWIALAPGLATGSGFLDAVVDVDTQRARHQAIYDSNKQYSDFLTWTKGKHTIVGGTNMRWLPTIHDRDDKVIGSVNSLVAALDGDHNFTIPTGNRLARDRKSTRLNSSHQIISYAVFCLKKKNSHSQMMPPQNTEIPLLHQSHPVEPCAQRNSARDSTRCTLPRLAS